MAEEAMKGSDLNDSGDVLKGHDITPDLTRLPRTVVPKRYELKLDIHPEDLRYEGHVSIRLVLAADDVQVVWLHASKDLRIVSAAFQTPSSARAEVDVASLLRVPAKSCVGVPIPDGVDASDFKLGKRVWLKMGFAGTLSRNLEGFFSIPFAVAKRSSGTTTTATCSKSTRLGAATMFAATEARSCFPCFDEPDLKAVFAIETTVDEDLAVISNMPVVSSSTKPCFAGRTDPGAAIPGGLEVNPRRLRRTDTFEWTKEMSTYLVCVVVGQFDFLEDVEPASRTKVRVYTPCGHRDKGRFALDVATKSLAFFNNYFGTQYPLPKLDLVALCRMSVGAMENWGIITCREDRMLVDLNDCSLGSLQRVATLIAHEISHQWFGNLVTMKWWKYLYLNEGFATFMQYLCVDELYPQFKAFDYFCCETLIPALGMDAMEHSHPIEVPLENASEISQVFDRITYCKGAAIISMLHDYLGPNTFKLGIQNYMTKFAYSNATTEDLWECLGNNVGHIMEDWVKELGFPLVRVSLVRRVVQDGGCLGDAEPIETSTSTVIRISQERFSNSESKNGRGLWSIPVTGIYTRSGGQPEESARRFHVLLDSDSTEVTLEDFDPVADSRCWLRLNPGLRGGFYRVCYTDEVMFNNLVSNLDSPHLTSVDRVGLFDDQVAMVLCDEAGGCTVRILEMARNLRHYDTSLIVWRSLLGTLHQIRTMTWSCGAGVSSTTRPICHSSHFRSCEDGDDDLTSRYNAFCRDLLRSLLFKLGFDMRNPLTNEGNRGWVWGGIVGKEARQCVSFLYCQLATYGDQEIRASARDLFQRHLDSLQSPGPDKEVASLRDFVRDAIYRAVMTCADQATFNRLKELYLASDSADERSRILTAFGYSEDPNIIQQVLELAISTEKTHGQESVVAIASVATNSRRGSRCAWEFLVANVDKLAERYSGGLFLMSRLIKVVTESIFDPECHRQAAAFFEANMHKLVGSEHSVKQALEHIRLNMSWKDKDIEALERFLKKYQQQRQQHLFHRHDHLQ